MFCPAQDGRLASTVHARSAAFISYRDRPLVGQVLSMVASSSSAIFSTVGDATWRSFLRVVGHVALDDLLALPPRRSTPAPSGYRRADVLVPNRWGTGSAIASRPGGS